MVAGAALVGSIAAWGSVSIDVADCEHGRWFLDLDIMDLGYALVVSI